MSVIYSRNYTTTCPGDLLDYINQDPQISPTLEQIVNDGTSTSYFYFSTSLTSSEETHFDNILATFVCPVNTGEISTETAVINDTQVGNHILWSSQQIQYELGNYIPMAQKGVNNGVATLDSSGKLTISQVPHIAITDTFVVNSQSEMLTLTAQKGDIAIRTDLNKSYILKGNDPSILSDWEELRTPTDAVLSVNGQTGHVTITNITGNAGTASTLQHIRTISATGDATWSVSFNGSQDVSGTLTLATVNSNVGTYGNATNVGSFTVNGKGLITSAMNVPINFPVTSVFGRTGTITAQEGDYTLNLLGDVTITSPSNGQVLQYNGSQWVNTTLPVGSGTVTYVGAQAPTEGFTISGSPITTSGTLVFTLSHDLAALEGLTTTGIAVRTGTSTWATRTIQGTTNQIDVANGSGATANPIISIAPNVILPGTGALTIPTGTTAQRPTSPTVGQMRYNTTTGYYEVWNGTMWLNLSTSIAGNGVREILYGQLAHLSGTSVIPYDNTPPLIDEGTEFFSRSITIDRVGQKIVMWFSTIVSISNSGRVATISLFRGSTLIGVTAAAVASTNAPTTVTFIVADEPPAVGTYTYSGRIGVSASATWYIGGFTALANYGGAANTNNQYVLMKTE